MPFPLKPHAILIDVVAPTVDRFAAHRRLQELELLTKTYGGIIVVKTIQKRSLPDYRTYIGSGKLNELFALARDEKIDVLIVNNLLKPKQIFEIEELARKSKTPIKIWDRVDLILKIFDKHAKTAEAKMQIKLAAIRHMGPRIFRMGMELMQQAGGTGTRGGPGETNVEIMKRHLAEQEKHVKKELERIARSRENHRRRRDRVGLKTVSIVGYTNAGKSSLLNALTNKKAYVANELFATLDTRIGKLILDNRMRGGDAEGRDPIPRAAASEHVWDTEAAGPASILLSDTIGFIQDLPPQLIDAFRSTLDETIDADLLLHVIDVSDPFMEDKIKEVESVLEQLGVSATPKIYVFNKIDLIKRVPRQTLLKKFRAFHPAFVSAHTGIGLEELKHTIYSLCQKSMN